jgi:hypothetical protein
MEREDVILQTGCSMFQKKVWLNGWLLRVVVKCMILDCERIIFMYFIICSLMNLINNPISDATLFPLIYGF